MPDRDEAQRRVDRIAAFRAELDAITASGLVTLTPDQRQAIGTYHEGLLQQYAAQFDVDRTAAAGQLSRGMRLASFFGAATLTAAIASLVDAVWGLLELPMQATLLCLFPLASLVGVELSARRERTLYIASLFATVAYGTYWIGVVVLSDLVNLPLSPLPIWAGVFFGLALALAYGFRLVLAASLLALVVAVGGSMFQGAGIPWTIVFQRPDLGTFLSFGLLLLARPLMRIDPSFGPATRLTALVPGFIGLLLLSSLGDMSLFPASNDTVQIFYQAVTFVTAVTALAIGVRRQMAEVVRPAATALSLFLLIRFVDWFWDALPAYAFFFALAAVAFGWLLVLRRIRGRLSRRSVTRTAGARP